MIATHAVAQSGGLWAASSIPWLDLALVLVGLLLLLLAGRIVYRRRRDEDDPESRMPLIEMPTPPAPGQPPRPAWPPAGRSPRPAGPLPAFVPHQTAERNARGPAPVAEEERGEEVRAGLVRFHRPPEGTLQLLPGRLDIVGGKEAVDAIRFVKVPGREPMVTFGRSPGEPHTHVELQSPTVSRQHAVMRFEKGSWHITNLSTTNPVVVRGRQLSVSDAPVRLEDGDQIEMGEVIFRFHTRQVVERGAGRVDPPLVERAAERVVPPQVERAAERVDRPLVEQAAERVDHSPVEHVAELVDRPLVKLPFELVDRPLVEHAGDSVDLPLVEHAAAVVDLPLGVEEGKVDVAARPRAWATGAARRPAPAPASASRAHTLTAREVEIAQMVADRKSNKAIGEVLDISPRTVSTHLTNIFRKLDVASRGELADYVTRHGTG